MTFLDRIIDGFNAVIDFLGRLFKPLFDLIAGAFDSLFQILATPIKWITWFFEGLFHFFEVLFACTVKVIQIFTALFQYLGALIAGVFRFIKDWLTVSPTDNVKFVSTADQGFSVVIDLLNGTGLLTVVPMVATAFVWFFFVMKVFGAFGGSVIVTPFGSSGGGDK